MLAVRNHWAAAVRFYVLLGAALPVTGVKKPSRNMEIIPMTINAFKDTNLTVVLVAFHQLSNAVRAISAASVLKAAAVPSTRYK